MARQIRGSFLGRRRQVLQRLLKVLLVRGMMIAVLCLLFYLNFQKYLHIYSNYTMHAKIFAILSHWLIF